MSKNGFRKRLRLVVLVLLLVLAVVSSALWAALRFSLNHPGGTFSVSGLEQPVSIHFDHRQRPFVRAASIKDALWAEGWLHARYRLWQMELLRRAGRGRLAEGLGEGLLESDRALWRAGVPQLAERLESLASGELLKQVDAYLAGVNEAISVNRMRPPEFWLAGLESHSWTRLDVFAVGAIIAFQSANNMDNELLRLALAAGLDDERFSVFLPDESSSGEFPYIIPEAKGKVDAAALDALDPLHVPRLPSAALGSSGWALAPDHTAAKQALFAFDSHDDLSLPNLFYEVHLFFGPQSSIRGWSLPGLPGVINGFNQHLAWGMTNIGDTQDLFLETRHPDRPDTFELDGDWYSAVREPVEIPVKGRDQAEQLIILHTRNGHLVSDNPPLSLRWTGHDLRGRGLESLLEMNTATDLASFTAALDRHGAPSANITYADRDGHTLFRTIGLIPERGSGRGLYPVAGNDSSNQWKGVVGDGQLPRMTDPRTGYVAAANARVHSGQPLISADNAAGYRMHRLHAVLGARRDFTLEDMQALQMDMHNSQAEKLLPVMLPALSDLAEGAALEAFHILREWADSPVNSVDSSGALLWEYWYPELAREVFGHGLDEDLLGRLMRRNYVLNHAMDRLILVDHGSSWWRGEKDSILHASFMRAVDELKQLAGTAPRDWRWDQVHNVYFKHELDGAAPLLGSWLSRGPFPWGGGHPVLARAKYRYDKPFTGRAGATVRVVAEMGSRAGGALEVHSIIPGGQHGHPSSTHYDDQLQSWLDGELDQLAESPEVVNGPVTVLQPLRPGD